MKLKKALVSDWYYTNAGAEKVIESINEIWTDFDHYALFDFLNDKDRNFILKGKKTTTSFLQSFPFTKKNHRVYLQLFPLAIEQLNVSNYNLVISSSSSVAKGVLTHSNQLHICYCHSPARYAWDLYHSSLADFGNNILKQIYARYVLHKFRTWDVQSANNVDYFIANSNYVAKRIKKVYNRDAITIYPPVDTEYFDLKNKKDDYYFIASRFVPYKKIDLIVDTFNQLPDKKIVIAGDGPQYKMLKKKAKSNIKILGHISREELKHHLQNAKGFIFPAEEDFGISPVEAQACGTPVIAFGKGGALETVENFKTGYFFSEQTVNSLSEAILEFEKLKFDYNYIAKHASKFSKERFKQEFKTFIESKIN